MAAAVGDHGYRDDQRAHGASEVAAHLEDGLCETALPARRERGDARGFRVDYRRAHAYGEHRQVDACEVGRQGEADDAEQGEGGGELKAALERAPVEHHAHERLEYRRRNLIDEGDGADLGEAQVEVVFYYRIGGGDRRLKQVIQEVSDAQRDQHRHRHGVHVFLSLVHRAAKILKIRIWTSRIPARPPCTGPL